MDSNRVDRNTTEKETTMTNRRSSEDDTQPIRVAIYARTSGPSEVDNSLNRQVAEATEFIRRLVPQHSVAETYLETGHSVWTGEADLRPEFGRMMSDARAGRFDVLVSVSVDRLSRIPVTLVKTILQLDEYGVGYVSTREGIDLRGPSGKLIMHMMEAFAEL